MICIGADHAYGDLQGALRALRGIVRPGGRLLLGTEFWKRTPTVTEAASIGMEPNSLHDLASLVDLAIATGFRPLSIQTASRGEWEQFESGFALTVTDHDQPLCVARKWHDVSSAVDRPRSARYPAIISARGMIRT
ncbi:MAG: hypothetical protein ACRDP8_19130 [Actinopolymorphaceae bacterium]